MCTITIYTKCFPSCTQNEHHQHAYHAVQWGYHPSESRIWPTLQLLLQMVDTCHYFKKIHLKTALQAIWTCNTIILSMEMKPTAAPPSQACLIVPKIGQIKHQLPKYQFWWNLTNLFKTNTKTPLKILKMFCTVLSSQKWPLPFLNQQISSTDRKLMSADETGSNPILPTSL